MLLLLELNELNFDHVQHYADRGALPNFRALLERHGRTETLSETRYEDLEPWIQWVTAHTGRTLAEHGVFHLGDIVETDIEQIWEMLAARGLKVGAISPMNAKCRTADLAFFVPDPWTRTGIIAPPAIERLYAAIAQAVNDNAEQRITPRSLVALARGFFGSVPLSRYARYAALLALARRRPWLKPVILDQLLSDVFAKLVKRHRTDFASLFLNAGAHIQHHYMFSSAAYRGEMRNPDDYVPAGMDPVLDVYRAYDAILGDVRRAFPDARLMLATGLHQDPHPTATYYWRLCDHAAYLRKIGVEFEAVKPRMSRDFAIDLMDEAAAEAAKAILAAAITSDGTPLFEIDDQGCALFVSLSYAANIDERLRYTIGDRRFDDLHDDVVFVALKNGQHNGIGYFVDTHTTGATPADRFPLKTLPERILGASVAG